MDMYRKMGLSKKSAKPGDLIAAAAKKQAMKKKAKKSKPMSVMATATGANRPMDGSTDQHAMSPMMKKKAMKKHKMTKAQYEMTARDRREDAAGMKAMKKKAKKSHTKACKYKSCAK